MNTTTDKISQAPGVDKGSIAIGATLLVSSFIGCILNVLLIFALIKGRLLSSTGTAVLKFILNMSLADILVNATVCFFIAPGIIFWHYKAVPSPVTVIPASVVRGIKYVQWVALTVVAVNRYLTICHKASREFPRNSKIVWWICGTSWVIAMLMAFGYQLWAPCQVYINYAAFGFVVFGNCANNYYNFIIQIPGNVIVTVTLIICYLLIFYKVRKSSVKVGASLQNKVTRMRLRRDIRLALQFVWISACFILIGLTFQLFQSCVRNVNPKIYSILTFAMVAESTANPLFIVIYNEEVLNTLKTTLFAYFVKTDSVGIYDVSSTNRRILKLQPATVD